MDFTPLDPPENGKFAHNITHFARALRKAGLPIGVGRVLDAITAARVAGVSDRADFFYTLQACFVSRPEHHAVFAQMFRLFWRDPKFLDHMMSLLTPMVRGVQEDRAAKPAEKRAAEALLDGAEQPVIEEREDGVEIDIDASQTVSAAHRLRVLDFEQMSTDEMTQAKRVLSTLKMPVKPLVSRRYKPGNRGGPDWQRTLRNMTRTGGEFRNIATKVKRTRPPTLVVLCDISGSMSAYSRAVLHFVHSVANQNADRWGHVHAFTFGTQLTNVTRHLRTRDVDAALAATGAHAQDWEGGTRIGACLNAFNRDWSRRVLGQGASVVLITDGLDRDPDADLGRAMDRLNRSSRQLIWLNPLLRWENFAPKAQGIQAMLPHVTSFRAGHNIASLQGLAAAIGDPDDHGERARMLAMMRS